jgi:hypothetical protein
MAGQGDLECFRTPGGHLRIVAGSLKGFTNGCLEHREGSALRDKQEEVEEVRLETQLLREKRELGGLKAEQEAEAKASCEAADLERRRIELEQERLKNRAREPEAAAAQERAALRAGKALAAFRSKWIEKGLDLCPSFLSSEQRSQITEALREEIEQHQPHEEPIHAGCHSPDRLETLD